MFRTKIVRPEMKLLDEEQGRVSAVVSTEAKDRDGDIIRVAGWDLAAFQKHPVLLSSHDYRSLRSVIGEWESMDVRGKRLVGTARYYIGEGNEEADWGFNLAKRRRAAFSVGFIPDMDKAEPIGDAEGFFRPMEFNGQELLEVSHVSIPSNPDALQRMKGLDLDPALAEVVDEVLREETDIQSILEGAARYRAGPDGQPGIDIRFDRLEGLLEEIAAAVKADQEDVTGEPENGHRDIDYAALFREVLSEGT